MSRKDTKPTMTWEEAPQIITPKDLSKILGIGEESARRIFDNPAFPKVSKKDIGNIGKADKEAVRLYIQGVNVKTNSKESLLYLILLELKKLNNSNEEPASKELINIDRAV